LLCKKIIVAKFKEMKTGCNLVESSKEGYGSKRAVLPMMMMMMMKHRMIKKCEAAGGMRIGRRN
jgi:hypothetical protein